MSGSCDGNVAVRLLLLIPFFLSLKTAAILNVFSIFLFWNDFLLTFVTNVSKFMCFLFSTTSPQTFPLRSFVPFLIVCFLGWFPGFNHHLPLTFFKFNFSQGTKSCPQKCTRASSGWCHTVTDLLPPVVEVGMVNDARHHLFYIRVEKRWIWFIWKLDFFCLMKPVKFDFMRMSENAGWSFFSVVLAVIKSCSQTSSCTVKLVHFMHWHAKP